jgi:hypothetical protein
VDTSVRSTEAPTEAAAETLNLFRTNALRLLALLARARHYAHLERGAFVWVCILVFRLDLEILVCYNLYKEGALYEFK